MRREKFPIELGMFPIRLLYERLMVLTIFVLVQNHCLLQYVSREQDTPYHEQAEVLCNHHQVSVRLSPLVE